MRIPTWLIILLLVIFFPNHLLAIFGFIILVGYYILISPYLLLKKILLAIKGISGEIKGTSVNLKKDAVSNYKKLNKYINNNFNKVFIISLVITLVIVAIYIAPNKTLDNIYQWTINIIGILYGIVMFGLIIFGATVGLYGLHKKKNKTKREIFLLCIYDVFALFILACIIGVPTYVYLIK